MAGAGYKLFTTGSVLTAADVNTYLNEQTVMVFADAAARTTALSGVLAEGMLSYLKDTDAVQYYNGSSWTTINTDQTPLTTKGDLFTYSTTDARLAVGNNGETLVADSSTSTGLRYNPQNALANPVINGGFDIWQRGTSGFVGTGNANTYTADRWNAYRFVAGSTFSRQTVSDTTNLPNIQYALRLQRDSGNTSAADILAATSIETTNSIPFAGRTVTLSFYARCGANFSASSNQISMQLRTGTGTDQNDINGFTNAAAPISAVPSLTTTWQRFAFTGTIATNATQLAVRTLYTPTGTAGANDWYEITGVQIDIGTYTASTAPAFRRAGGTLAGELAACQRYYYRNTPAASGVSLGQGSANGSRYVLGVINLPVSMRVAPTSADFSAIFATDGVNAGVTISALAAYGNSQTTATYYFDCTSGLTQYRNYKIDTSSSSGYLGFSAEL